MNNGWIIIIITCFYTVLLIKFPRLFLQTDHQIDLLDYNSFHFFFGLKLRFIILLLTWYKGFVFVLWIILYNIDIFAEKTKYYMYVI